MDMRFQSLKILNLHFEDFLLDIYTQHTPYPLPIHLAPSLYPLSSFYNWCE